MQSREHSEAFGREAPFRQVGPLVGAVLLWLAYSETPRLPDEYSETIIWGAGMIAVAVILTCWRGSAAMISQC